MRKIKENSKTNCPNCSKKKSFNYSGWCPECTYQEENTKKEDRISEGLSNSQNTERSLSTQEKNQDYCDNCEKYVNLIDINNSGSFGCPFCKRDDCITTFYNSDDDEKTEENSLLTELKSFTGTENYYKASIIGNLKVTDGVQFLRNKVNCYWLIDLIGSYQNKLRNESFQVWTLEVTGNKGVVVCSDGNNNKLLSQNIPYTDFKEQSGLTKIDLWCVNDVIMLPSEY